MVKAKPLKWVESPRHGKRVHAAMDYETIEHYPSGAAQYCVLYRGLPRGFANDYPTLEAAKAAAQADYEKRVLACLEDTPTDPWQPIETAPKDGYFFEAWHVIHKCWVSVKFLDTPWNGCELIEKTMTSTWPLAAFS